ncbi:helix-turn-helix transcriptional regulator, partial [Photobacterium sp. BZF1]|uniref:helix-turn-helix transcriptional regulator n=1 Tax=Photobacterium sp. BZF1 TaxID=1904457 RepID=UPI0016534937
MSKINFNRSRYPKRILKKYQELMPHIDTLQLSNDFDDIVSNIDLTLQLLSQLVPSASEKSVFYEIGRALYFEDLLYIYQERKLSLLENILLCLQHYSIVNPSSINELKVNENRAVFRLWRKRNIKLDLKPINAVIVGYNMALLENHLGSSYKEKEVSIIFWGSDYLPDTLQVNKALASFGNREEIIINFPVHWLVKPLNNMDYIPEPTQIEIIRCCCLENISDSLWTIDKLAHKTGISKRSLQRLLANKKSTFRTMMQELRIEKTKELLSKSEVSISDISDIVGFSEPSALSRAFK